MQQFTCPYNRAFCGSDTASIAMHPELRNNLIVEIQNYLFVDTAVCYYNFYVPESDLDMENNRYFFEVEFDFENMINTNAYIMNGTEPATADEIINVNYYSGYTFQYEAENNQIYMTFTGDAPDEDDDDPTFSFQIRLYTFRVTAYTDEEIAEEKALLDLDEEGEDETEEDEPEVVTVIIEEVVVRDEKVEKPRVKQHGLTVLICGAMLAIIIYMLVTGIESC